MHRQLSKGCCSQGLIKRLSNQLSTVYTVLSLSPQYVYLFSNQDESSTVLDVVIGGTINSQIVSPIITVGYNTYGSRFLFP